MTLARRMFRMFTDAAVLAVFIYAALRMVGTVAALTFPGALQ